MARLTPPVPKKTRIAKQIDGRNVEGQWNYSGQGWRHCDACNWATKGPREKNCVQCGAEFPASRTKVNSGGRRKYTKKTEGPTNAVESLKLTIEKIQALGGIDEVERLISEADKLNWIGGVDGAKQSVALLRSVDELFRGK